MSRLRFKLPQQFINKHGEVLEAFDWDNSPEMWMTLEGPNGKREPVRFEAIERGGELVIRSADAISMLRVRAYSERLSPTPPPDPKVVEAVLATRNPAKEETL